MKRLTLVLTLLLVFGVCATGYGANAQFDGLIGLTVNEVHQRLGEPDYIRVYDYGLGDRYTYFTPEEWELLQDTAPQVPGDDVYIQTVDNNTLQYHISYAPVYVGESKRQPNLYVNEYTVYTTSPLRLADLPQYLPPVANAVTQIRDGQLRSNKPPYLPALVLQTPGNQKDLSKLFRRFRERGDLNVQIEIGLQGLVETAALGPNVTVGYVLVRAGILDKSGTTTISTDKVFAK